MPALTFTDVEFRVPIYVRIRNKLSKNDPDGARKFNANGEPYLDEAFFALIGVNRRGDESSELTYAVEDQEESEKYSICDTPDRCRNVVVDVVPNTGRLSLRFEEGNAQLSYVNDYTRRKLELSVADESLGRKIFREVYLGPPEQIVDCDDFPDETPQKYSCLFLPELLPAELDSMSRGVDVEALRTRLPDMVQPRDNYRLLFAEEFSGVAPAPDSSGCRDSLSSVDLDIWTAHNSCLRVDASNQPCTNISDGQLVLGLSKRCSAKLRTLGRFHVRYGYIEIEFTVDLLLARGYYSNYHAVLSGLYNKLHYHWEKYGVEVEDMEDYLRNAEVEIDLIEYIQNARASVWHQYVNWSFHAKDPDIVPTRSSKEIRFCNWAPNRIIAGFNCGHYGTTSATVTLGIEWTPRGYVTHLKIHGVHAELEQIAKDVIRVEYKPLVRGPSGELTPQGWSVHEGPDREKFFEYIESGDRGTQLLLEQVGVAHVPQPIGVGTSGYLPNTSIVKWLKMDYIRLWQPQNYYSDMEPVYQ